MEQEYIVNKEKNYRDAYADRAGWLQAEASQREGLQIRARVASILISLAIRLEPMATEPVEIRSDTAGSTA